jgi:hypothetical protein
MEASDLQSGPRIRGRLKLYGSRSRLGTCLCDMPPWMGKCSLPFPVIHPARSESEPAPAEWRFKVPVAYGTAPARRSPLRAQPRNGPMLVLIHVSSIERAVSLQGRCNAA